MTSQNSAPPQVKLLSPWRRRFQWLSTLLILLIPWVQVQGKSLFRIDISSLSLHLFGQVLRIEELFLFLLFCLCFAIAFLLTTLIFGRVWCGWGCPQTTLNDITEWFAAKLKLKIVNNRLTGRAWRKALVQLVYLALALLVAANLIWYFIEPQRFFRLLFSWQLGFGVTSTFLVITLVVYLDLALLRRLMCKEFCPYGRIQTALVDTGTLTLHLPESEKERCIRCNSCVRCCPMEIDIREGYQVECINCGRCLDACRKVMHKRRQPGLIYYTFGIGNRGAKALLNPRTLVLGGALLILTGALGFAISNRSVATLKVALSHTAGSRLMDDRQQATFFNGWINNRSTESNTFRIVARRPDGTALDVRGQTARLQLSGGENRKIDFVLVSPAVRSPSMVEFVLFGSQDEPLAVSQAQVNPVVSKKDN